MRSIAALSLVAGLGLAVPAAAAPKNPAPLAEDAAVRGGAGDPELASLRRQLASAVLVSELKLSAEQKSALRKVIAEAKLLRQEAVRDRDLADVRAERKAALRKAIEEVHATGALSNASRDSLKAGKKEAFEESAEIRAKMKDLRTSMKGILTAEQMERLKELRVAKIGKMKGARGEALKGKMKMKKKGLRGGKALRRLMLSDEFEAELGR